MYGIAQTSLDRLKEMKLVEKDCWNSYPIAGETKHPRSAPSRGCDHGNGAVSSQPKFEGALEANITGPRQRPAPTAFANGYESSLAPSRKYNTPFSKNFATPDPFRYGRG